MAPPAGYVMKLCGLASGDPVPAFDDKYVVDYDPLKWRYREVASTAELEAMLAEFVTVTDDPAEARIFADAGAFHEFWAQVGHGIRPDGKPNRPLTAFHVQLAPAPAPNPVSSPIVEPEGESDG